MSENGYVEPTPLPPWERHMTAKDVAKYFRSRKGNRVGRKYATTRDLWNEKDSVVQVGLLHLVVDRLEELNSKFNGGESQVILNANRDWLVLYYELAVRLIKEHNRERKRIGQFCDISLLRSDCKPIDIGDVAREYLRRVSWRFNGHVNVGYPYCVVDELARTVKRLRSVKTLDDIENLKGIGRRTAERIRQKVKALKP